MRCRFVSSIAIYTSFKLPVARLLSSWPRPRYWSRTVCAYNTAYSL